MEFIKVNYIQTSTSIVVGSNTLSAKNLLSRDPDFQYSTEDFNDDLTTGSIVFNFDVTQTVSRIALQGINLKSFTLFYNGVTASTFAMTSTSSTTVSDWLTNSETSMYIVTTPVDCTSVTLDMHSTQVADSEKAVGYSVLSDLTLDFERIPSAKNYKPDLSPKQVVHKLSDGGARIHSVDEKWNAKIKYKNISEDFRNDLRAVHKTKSAFMFTAFPTSTAWDEVFFECVWPGKFDGYRYSDDAVQSGHDISIDLRET